MGEMLQHWRAAIGKWREAAGKRRGGGRKRRMERPRIFFQKTIRLIRDDEGKSKRRITFHAYSLQPLVLLGFDIRVRIWLQFI